MNIGTRIKKVRLMLNKSQQDLADMLNVTKQAISNIETGKSSAGLNLLSKLLLDYKVNLNYIIAGTGAVFLQDENTTASLRNSIIKEVENMLDERGIN
ncbi:MAG: helix-turn-helix transcriptional regulator [Candidatus Gastranaerophilales bacterium]|nr:helix-turn-helix transcriptional regulator [Candidatus Gastranaerophilales bacterium]